MVGTLENVAAGEIDVQKELSFLKNRICIPRDIIRETPGKSGSSILNFLTMAPMTAQGIL